MSRKYIVGKRRLQQLAQREANQFVKSVEETVQRQVTPDPGTLVRGGMAEPSFICNNENDEFETAL